MHRIAVPFVECLRKNSRNFNMKILVLGFQDYEVESLREVLSDIGDIVTVPYSMEYRTFHEVLELSNNFPCDWTCYKVVISTERKIFKEIVERVRLLGFSDVVVIGAEKSFLELSVEEFLERLIEELDFIKIGPKLRFI